MSENIVDVLIILLGLGNIGGTLLQQILDTRTTLAQRMGVCVKPVAIADISGVLHAEAGLPEATLRTALDAVSQTGSLAGLGNLRSLDALPSLLKPGVLVADLTASPHTASTLRTALDIGCRVVLANKIPVTAPWDEA